MATQVQHLQAQSGKQREKIIELTKERDAALAEMERLDGELLRGNEGLFRFDRLVSDLRAACQSAIDDLRRHDDDDEGGYIDDTEADLVEAMSKEGGA